jgi:hypothetical protein
VNRCEEERWGEEERRRRRRRRTRRRRRGLEGAISQVLRGFNSCQKRSIIVTRDLLLSKETY